MQVFVCFVVVVVIVDGYLVGHPSYKHEIVWFLEPKQSKDWKMMGWNQASPMPWFLGSNHSDLTRPGPPKGSWEREIPLKYGQSRLVKYYILARWFGIIQMNKVKTCQLHKNHQVHCNDGFHHRNQNNTTCESGNGCFQPENSSELTCFEHLLSCA